jgi:hypothetical protein
VRYLLDRNPCMRLVRQTPHVGGWDAKKGRVHSFEVLSAAPSADGDRLGAVGGLGAVDAPAVDAVACGATGGLSLRDVRGAGAAGSAWRTERWLTEAESCLVQRFDPSGPLDTIGFFIAKFEKSSSAAWDE